MNFGLLCAVKRSTAAILLAATLATPAIGDDASAVPGATLPELLEWVDRRNPELASMRLEAEAAQERIYPAGALPDPMFQIELRDISRSNPNLLPARVGSTKYTISQSLPWWGKRDLRRQVAEAQAQAAGGRAVQTRAELHARVKSAYAGYYGAVEAAGITEAIVELVGALEQAAASRYATGLVPQQDVIKAQAERTTLKGELIRLAAERRQAAARLNSVLNRPSAAALAAPESLGPMPQSLLEPSTLDEQAARGNPLLAVQRSQVAGAQRARELARKNRYPDFNIGVSPVQRGERLDGWEAMFEVNIPLQRETRYAQEREAAAMLAAAQARADAIVAQVQGELGEAVAGFNAALEQQRLLADTLLPQAELTFRSALASYETGQVDFATLLDAQRQIRRTRLDILNARVTQRLRLAEIERLVGEQR